MPKISALLLIAGLLLLTACSHTPPKSSLAAEKQPLIEYCDSYFSYDMCVKDTDHNGSVDLMYFNDTKEVFMALEGFDITTQPALGLHRCPQVMDTDLQDAASKLLWVDTVSAVERSRIKMRLILSYTRYLSKINRCMKGSSGPAVAMEEHDSFGDEDFDDSGWGR